MLLILTLERTDCFWDARTEYFCWSLPSAEPILFKILPCCPFEAVLRSPTSFIVSCAFGASRERLVFNRACGSFLLIEVLTTDWRFTSSFYFGSRLNCVKAEDYLTVLTGSKSILTSLSSNSCLLTEYTGILFFWQFSCEMVLASPPALILREVVCAIGSSFNSCSISLIFSALYFAFALWRSPIWNRQSLHQTWTHVWLQNI